MPRTFYFKDCVTTMATIDEALTRLKRSSFRAKFRLGAKERNYLLEKGWGTIREHAFDFISKRLAPAMPKNDGKQTPMRGHPIFIAQHACACCCRGCLEKWYHIPRGRALTSLEQQRIVNLLLAWLEHQLKDL